MASPQGLNLERSMDQFRRELTDDQRKEISGANRMVISHEIEKLQAKVGSQGRLCKLGRMNRFLDTMEEVEKLVTIFLNVSEVVAFIWGPIKLVLMVATTWTKSVKNIVDVYEEIAVSLDNLAVFYNLIRNNEHLKRMLEDYFSDILRFNRSILAVFSKPDWKRMFLFVWREFRRNIEPIIESLKRKQAMLSDDKLQQHAILKTLQDSDSYAKCQFEQMHSGLDDVLNLERLRSQERENEQIKSCLERKLNVSLSQVSSQLQLPDTVIESSGSWILSHPRFQSWKSSVSSQECVLFLNGCPGAGKSTLAKTIIRYLNDEQSRQFPPQRSVFYFFFKHNDANRRSTRTMLCHIITQIINADKTMMRFTYDRYSSVDYLNLSLLKSLALDCLLSQRDTIIILDGLDEAKDKEPEHALNWCLYELLRMAPSRGCRVRLLICGQEDGRIEPRLSSYPQIRLHTADSHKKDIEEYCKDRATLIGSRFRLPPDDVRVLIIKVSNAAKGMFLYAKVVLANLESMGSRKEYKAELEGNGFPRNLDEAYERILQRAIHAATPSTQTSAKKILGWLVCSERPLRWREIQSRFCIDVDSGLCDPDDVRVDTCKQLCSSLVEATDCELFPGVASEQTFTIIHETASKYLVHTNTIDLMQEHIAMSLFSCRYLCSRPFFSMATDEVQDAVKSGYFGFMDYAAAFYQPHITKAKLLSTNSDAGLNFITAQDALSDLERVYCSSVSDTLVETDTTTGHSREIRKALVQAIQDKVLDIRAIIDTHRDKRLQDTGFKELEGENRRKCPRIQCLKFSVGYLNEALLQQHLTSHERPFRCKYESCFAYVVGYTSQENLQRHSHYHHNEEFRAKTRFPIGIKASKNDLISACRSGDLKRVQILHQLGADLCDPSTGKSPLMVAFEARHDHICKYLVENGVSPLTPSLLPPERSPLLLAIDNQDFHMLELFLFGYQELTSPLNGPRLAECILDMLVNYPSSVDILLRLSASKESEEARSTIESCLVEQLAIWLYRQGGFRPLPMDPGVSVHSHDATPIHTTFRHMFRKLYVGNNFSPNRNCQEYRIYQQTMIRNSVLLRRAIVRKGYSLAAFLMDIDVDNVMQTEDKAGNSLLHEFIDTLYDVACDGCVLMVKRLIKLDGDFEFARRPNKNGNSLVHIALQNNLSPPILRILVEFSRDLNHKNRWGMSPLHCVHSEESMSILLQYKAVDIFSRDRVGQTCFVRYCKDRVTFDEGILRRLLEREIRLAWTSDESTEGRTPLDYAMEPSFGTDLRAAKFLLNLPEVERVLEAYMASPSRECERVRNFAETENLEHALQVMDQMGFGLPHRTQTQGLIEPTRQ